jgi:hypothetical protein
MRYSENNAAKKGRHNMSNEEGDTFWISLAEKFFGLILLIIGSILLYFTATSTTQLGAFTAFFGFLGIIVIAIGLILLLVKPPT